MSNQPYYPPYDQSESSQGHQSSRSNYPQQAYNQYSQSPYGHMGYADMSQSGQRYSQTMQYPQDSVDGGQYINQDGYAVPSFSPTAATFAQSHSYGPPASADAMTYRRRYEPTSALPSEPRNPMPRHPSGEVPMASVHEAREFVPVPSQPFYESNAPVSRPTSGRSPNIGQSTSALALERPYVCDICQTRFARHHDCRRHRETHVVNASGEKPHHCVVCGKVSVAERHTNQKGCDINAASASTPARSSRSSSSSSPQQVPATFYPVSNLPQMSGSGHPGLHVRCSLYSYAPCPCIASQATETSGPEKITHRLRSIAGMNKQARIWQARGEISGYPSCSGLVENVVFSLRGHAFPRLGQFDVMAF
ncbi:hypothetical protein AG1IA_02997 [Rhizoctonia solani AG-1 IA]|uniref:C2H2-type domain-containing protein n=1 Tax=Thanatephorus cucumeris (strain AG1-IA) TaxID=983506 RepID=L8WY91_THACA|nr:hypothetical protein AG1IA_02997 [Rhizoctonia solani AG-1 IA]